MPFLRVRFQIFIVSCFCVVFVSRFAGAVSVKAEHYDPNRYLPSFTPDGFLNLQTGVVQPHLFWNAGLLLDYTNDLITLQQKPPGSSEERLGAPLHDRVEAHLYGSIALLNWIQVGLHLPVIAYQNRDSNAIHLFELRSIVGTGVGDLEIQPKIRILKHDTQGVDLAFLPAFTVPTSSHSDSYLGERFLTASPQFLLSREMKGVTIAWNIGARFRDESSRKRMMLKHGYEYFSRLGLGYSLQQYAHIPLSIHATFDINNSDTIPFVDKNDRGLEAFLGMHYQVRDSVQLQVGGGMGFLATYGIPDYRVLAGVMFTGKRKNTVTEKSFIKPEPVVVKPVEVIEVKPVPAVPVTPPPDEDTDGVPDAIDNCPKITGEIRYQGCKAPQVAKIVGCKIEITDKVLFVAGKTVILSKSQNLLNNIVEILKAQERIQKIRIEGHTDNSGDDAKNLILSQGRAKAVVNYLIKQGISASRLEFLGLGETAPIADNLTPEGRSMNRRVEFHILNCEEKVTE